MWDSRGKEGNDKMGKIIKVILEAQGEVVLGNLKTQSQKAKGIQLILMRQDPGNEGRLRHVKDPGGKWKIGRGTPGNEGHGKRYRRPSRGLVTPRSDTLEVGLVLLELHHEVVDVDELSPGREGSELGLRQHPVETMIELYQLGQRSLDDTGSISEVGETPHYILT